MNKYFQSASTRWVAYILIISVSSSCQSSPSDEEEQSWIQLFNGEDIDDWRVKITGYPLNENFANTYRVEDGKLKVWYEGYDKFNERFGNIFYKEKFSNYVLGVEYRFFGEQAREGPGWAVRNSGAMIHSQAPETMLVDQDFPISIEAQFLGGNGKDERPTANLCTPGTNVVLDGELFTSHCISSRSRTYHGDEWVRVEILVLGDSLIEHFVEGESVLLYEKPQIGGGNVINYDQTVKNDGELLSEGYIALQSESHPIEFRKVELFDLTPYVGKSESLYNILKSLGLRQ